MVLPAGIAPATLSFEASRSNSAELRELERGRLSVCRGYISCEGMPDYPEQVQAFLDALSGLPAVSETRSAVQCLWGVTPEALAFVDFGDFPHAAIRWAGGGKQDQALAQFEFRLEPSREGWRTLEFIAWWVRDNSRGGTDIQLRPNALPPETALGVQFGRTLKFSIDHFAVVKGDDLTPLLASIKQLADSLTAEITAHRELLNGPTMN
jgi:hypothetical protein